MLTHSLPLSPQPECTVFPSVGREGCPSINGTLLHTRVVTQEVANTTVGNRENHTDTPIVCNRTPVGKNVVQFADWHAGMRVRTLLDSFLTQVCENS